MIEYMETKQVISEVKLQQIKQQISNEVNPKNIKESMILLSNSDLLQKALQNASDNFKKQVGREMTYSEMREMMG